MEHARIVYVDSGSTDGSIQVALDAGSLVSALNMQLPFTAARARNEGARIAFESVAAPDFIQFVDGDCEVAPGWMPEAMTFLDQHPEVAAVCGRRRERHPERSIYNLLCDIEWNTPIGEAKACGGDVMMRAAAFRAVGGFRESLIAGEEPELCIRLRAAGWKIWRLDAEMTLHDAAMTRLGQWWRRCTRAGFAFAEGVRLHGGPAEHHWVREALSGWVWAGLLPLLILSSGLVFGPVGLLGLLMYPLQVARLALRSPDGTPARWARAFFLVAGKFPELLGQAKAWLSHVRHREAALIEYK